MSKKSKLLRSQVDDTFVGGGHQVVKARERKRTIPEWATDRRRVREILLRSFPKLQTNPRQRDRAARWARIIQLYFCAHYTNKQVAEEMGLSLMQAKNAILHIRRAAVGKRSDGRGPLTGKR